MRIWKLLGALSWAALVCNGATDDANPARAVLDKRVDGLEKQLLAIAEAMPAEHYGFAPTNGAFRGVRNFAKQLKHAAAFHYIVGATLLGEAPPADAADERGPESLKGKAEVIQYVKDSFAYLRKGIATIDTKNLVEPFKNSVSANETRLGLVVAAIGHSFDHYGQMIEYLRMNNVVPPQSQ